MANQLERSDILFEFLAIMRSALILPLPLRPMQPCLVKLGQLAPRLMADPRQARTSCSRPSVLLRQSVRMGLNRRMGEKLRDRRRICPEDDEKEASGQSKVLPKIPEQRTGLAVA
jgi:hypothetical protein